MLPVATTFQCPPDCGWCCTHLERAVDRDEARATEDFRAALRDLGVYHCRDAVTKGLSLSNAEADALRDEAEARGLRIKLHPRTFLLETRRRDAVVLDWHFPHVECPFYSDFKCTAYDKRPLVCRAYPVLAPAPRWRLAPECPRAAPTQEAVEAGALKLGVFLRGENKARHAVERASAALDEAAWRVLDTPSARFVKGLSAVEAEKRVRAYRLLSPEAFLAAAAKR